MSNEDLTRRAEKIIEVLDSPYSHKQSREWADIIRELLTALRAAESAGKENNKLKALNSSQADVIKQLFIHQREMEEMLKWQPIETAPEKWEEILVCFPRLGNNMQLAYYNTVHKHWCIKGDYTKFHEGDLWMPIPPVEGE